MDNEKMKEVLERMKMNRPKFPKRAVVTAGMPYGSKNLHYGHVCGMMVYADFFARFLKDKLGKENVLFVSGTDCYGSPALEAYRKKCADGFSGTIEDMVSEYNKNHIETIKKYEIGFDLFGGSAIGESKEMHKKVSEEIFENFTKEELCQRWKPSNFMITKLRAF